MILEPQKKYKDEGYCYLRDSIDIKLLNNIEENIVDLILATVKRLPKNKQDEFNACDFEKEELPHSGLIKLYELSPKFQQVVVDALVVSSSVYRLLLDKTLLKSVGQLINVELNNMIINSVHVRVDLPSKFETLTANIELPAHQESSYFQKNIDPYNAAVVWIPIFDCGPDEGSLEIYPKSHKLGDIKHKGEYLKANQKKHFRNKVSSEVLKKFKSMRLNTKKGDCAIQHFDLIHRSAKNHTENKVRYTILLRTGNLMSPNFIPSSWAS